MQEKIKNKIIESLKNLGIEILSFEVEAPELSKGDYASNVALVAGKRLQKNPLELAETLKNELGDIEGISEIEAVAPGFLNFKLSEAELLKNVEQATKEDFGQSKSLEGKKVLVEYAQPNPFKPLHIGHVMAITAGESVYRLFKMCGANVERANYQGDVGRHVACAIYGILKMDEERPSPESSPSEIADYLGRAYVFGSQALEESEEEKKKINDLNKVIFEKSDKDINAIYEWGREKSLEYFETIYSKLDTKFDHYFFESQVAENGVRLVKENIGLVFEESDGAIVFPGEKYGLHTRVFLNSEGLPTYEAKEIGLAEKKMKEINPDLSITDTGNEQKNYFEVVTKALSLIYPDFASKMRHITHGLMRLPTGKMSSRLGNVITGESLISGVENLVLSKLEERGLTDEEKRSIVLDVAIGAIKYSVLKAAPGKDINFDFEKSISFEGDSGPYLQYTAVRIESLLRKASEEGLSASMEEPEELGNIERKIFHFGEVVEEAMQEIAPQHIATYLIELASLYNSYYASHPVIGSDKAAYRLYLSKAVLNVLRKGLWILGIKVPEKM